MFSWFRDHFLPHPGNDHRPHVFGADVFLGCVAAIMGLEILFLLYIVVVVPNARFLGEILPNVLVGLTNEDRAAVQQKPLAVNEKLVAAARAKAQDMAAQGYFAHTSPVGVTPWHWLNQAGYSYVQAGENLAVNFVDSSDVERAWMASPSHRANIVRSDFTEVGIATAVGMYEGRQAVFVVQFFGTPQTFAVPTRVSEGSLPVSSASSGREGPVRTPGAVAPAPAVVETSVGAPAALGESVAVPSPTVPETGGSFSDTVAVALQTIVGNPASFVFVILCILATIMLGVWGGALVVARAQVHSDVLVRGTALLAIIALVLVFNTAFPFVKTQILAYSAVQIL